MYFTADQTHILSDIETLKPEKWKTSTPEQQREALQECENRISQFEGRPSRKVEIAQFSGEYTNLDGMYDRKTKTIQISKDWFSENSIQDKDSYNKAFRILIEESHHAFQSYALHEEPGFFQGQEFNDWRDIPYDPKDPNYADHPIERSAKAIAKSADKALKEEHEKEKSSEHLSAQVLAIEERPGKDPMIWVQFAKDEKPRGYTVAGFQPGDNLRDIEISGDFIAKLENLRQGEVAKGKFSTQTVKDDQKVQTNQHQHSIERQKEGEKER
ncbi:MAG: hypothetical protein KME07_08940 [Pegethrix bostrychoides GSE-TBD4-15B]|jgi:hypothetical protein|uniref:Uncharacterized protein n=1 Tax=Pegethrix bostrychoides GSE-TBD4-15B TaxID=2839662 RepID=A0A951PA41_9CYAN|nr:hypothetical protein [Pegethrix bostrychoides GSE-TBD4-15B]